MKCLYYIHTTLNTKPTTERASTFSFFIMLPLLAILLLLPQIASTLSDQNQSFTFNGFKSTNLTLDGLARITPNGLLCLSNATRRKTGHAFYPTPFDFKNSPNSSVFSFSTHFVFAIVPEFQPIGGHGMAFVVAPTRGLPGALPGTYLGLFNDSNNGNLSNHIVAVELDTLRNQEFKVKDIDDNHVGIDINSLESVLAEPAGYYDNQTSAFHNLTLNNGRIMQVWIGYDGVSKLFNVTLAPLEEVKPRIPLLSLRYDLSPVLNQIMYVGFSSSPLFTSFYVLGWSFKIKGVAQPLDLSQLPDLPRVGPKKQSKFLTVGLPFILGGLVLLGIFTIGFYVRRKWKYAEVLEGWEVDYIPQRFIYKDLYIATKGFKDKELLGTGGFGKVYKGIMPGSGIEIAVKRVSHESRQGMKEFVAEIASIGRLRHRNLVPLLGYCRRKGELLLVYEYMPNGSLDKFLHDNPACTLNWEKRFCIIKGVALGLVYLHEEWEQVVIHRDIKASNVLLDGEFKARLGDFGLARLYDHGSDPRTTHIVGTLGYLAPEHTRTGRATTSTDVYAFGAFLLEVVCGRRPIEPKGDCERSVLVEWVFSLWSAGEILEAVDPNLGRDYNKEEAELVLKLGLLCSHSRAEVRPGMREIVRYLEGAVVFPDLVSANGLDVTFCEGFDDFRRPHSSTSTGTFTGSTSVTHSLISSGR